MRTLPDMKARIRVILCHIRDAVLQCCYQPATALGWLTEGLWVSIIALVPLFFLPFCLRGFYPPKALLLQVLALLLLAAAAGAWLLRQDRSRTRPLRNLFPTTLHRAVFAFALVGIYGIAAALQGCMEAPLNWPLRAVAFAAGVAAVWPTNFAVDLAGIAVVLALLAWTVRTDRRRLAPVTAVA